MQWNPSWMEFLWNIFAISSPQYPEEEADEENIMEVESEININKMEEEIEVGIIYYLKRDIFYNSTEGI